MDGAHDLRTNWTDHAFTLVLRTAVAFPQGDRNGKEMVNEHWGDGGRGVKYSKRGFDGRRRDILKRGDENARAEINC